MNMKQKSPIDIVKIQFYAYTTAQADDLTSVSKFPFDDRSDFIADSSLGGIAVMIAVNNLRFDSGVRRNVTLTLVDTTARCEVDTQPVKINLCKQEWLKKQYARFPAADFKPGNTYKLVVSDPIASEALYEKAFRIMDHAVLPHPSEWYRVRNCALRRAWESDLYKNLRTEDGISYYVGFQVEYKLGYLLPTVKPELELHLHLPDGEDTIVKFSEPVCLSEDDYKECLWCVEFPFTTSYDRNGIFYAELLCMEYPIAGFVFNSEADDEPGKLYGESIAPLDEYSREAAMKRWTAGASRDDSASSDSELDFDKLLDDFIAVEQAKSETESDDTSRECDEKDPDECASVDTPLLQMDNLTGLSSVKQKLSVYERVVRFNKMRADKGLTTTSAPLHAMFLGSPGTGKTTVARMIGNMLHHAGILSKGHLVVRERATLLGQNYNSEAEKTLAAIEEARGGILFIDEAYQLYQPNDARDPGKFVIETLLTALSDESNRDWMLILAGYPDMMKRMFEMNPGFKSRIPDSNIYTFDDFTEPELMEIAEKYLGRNNYTLSADARKALSLRLNADYASRDQSFGNARYVINMIQTEILPSMAVRVIDQGLDDDAALTEICVSDIPPAVAKPTASRPRIGFSI